MNFVEFVNKLNKKKPFRNLSEEYKTDKFLRLYYKIYEYMESIPKEEIVYKRIREDIIRFGLVYYIERFLKAKDFYNWKSRIYTLLTKKIAGGDFLKWRLMYNSFAVKFFKDYTNKIIESDKRTNRERYNVDYPLQNKEIYNKMVETNNKRYNVSNVFQLEEVKEKSKKKNLEKRGVEYASQSKEVQEKSKTTSLKNWGTEHPFQSKEVQEKYKETSLKNWGTEWPSQSKEVQEKKKNIYRERYNVDNPFQILWVKENNKNNFRSHSKIADDFCISLYNILSDEMKLYCFFYKKDNKEYGLRDKDKFYRYDFTFIRESVKVVVEFDGLYWHGLKENQKDVRGIPVEEVWSNDLEKQRVAEDNGFVVIRVREDEYIENKDVVLNKLKDALENELRYKI